MNFLKKIYLILALASTVCSQVVTIQADFCKPCGKKKTIHAHKVVTDKLCVKDDAKIGGDLCVQGTIFNTTKRVLVKGAEDFYFPSAVAFDRFHPNDRVMYVTDEVGGDIVIMDPVKKGTIKERIATMTGANDDLVIGPDTAMDPAGVMRGTIYYTIVSATGGIGRIHPDGSQDVILQGMLPFSNGISFNETGTRLFVSQVFNIPTNGVFEVLNFDDPNPLVPTLSTIVADITDGAPNHDSFGGGLQGFTVKGGFIYGPLWYTGTVVKIDTNSPFTVITVPSYDALGNQIILYAADCTDFDSLGRLVVIDAFGKIIRINNLNSAPGVPNTDVVANGLINIDGMRLDSQNTIYFGGRSLADVAYLTQVGCKRAVSQSGIGPAFGLALLDNELFVSEAFLIGVYNKATGDLKRDIIQPDWLPDPNLFNFGSFIAPGTVSPMPNQKLLISTFFPSGRIGILDLQCNEMLSLILADPLSLFLWDAIALNDNTIIVCGNDANTGVPAVQKLILNDDYSLNTVIPIPVTGLVFPVSLAKSPDGTKVWVSDYFGNTIYEIFSNTVLVSGLQNPEGIALDVDAQHLLFLEQGTSSLKSIDLATKHIAVVADNLGALNLTPPNFLPQGITSRVVVDPMSSIIYVTATGDRQLLEIRRTCC